MYVDRCVPVIYAILIQSPPSWGLLIYYSGIIYQNTGKFNMVFRKAYIFLLVFLLLLIFE